MPRLSPQISAWFQPVHQLLAPAPSRPAPEQPPEGGWPVRGGQASWGWLKRQILRDSGVHAALLRSMDLALSTAVPAWLRVEAGWQLIGRDCLEGCTLLHLEDGHVAHVTRDGRCGTVAMSLPEWLSILCALPFWRDVVEYSAGADLASMRAQSLAVHAHAERELPELTQDRALLVTALWLAPGVWPDHRPGVAAVDRLHHALTHLAAPGAWVEDQRCRPLAGERSPAQWKDLNLDWNLAA